MDKRNNQPDQILPKIPLDNHQNDEQIQKPFREIQRPNNQPRSYFILKDQYLSPPRQNLTSRIIFEHIHHPNVPNNEKVALFEESLIAIPPFIYDPNSETLNPSPSIRANNSRINNFPPKMQCSKEGSTGMSIQFSTQVKISKTIQGELSPIMNILQPLKEDQTKHRETISMCGSSISHLLQKFMSTPTGTDALIQLGIGPTKPNSTRSSRNYDLYRSRSDSLSIMSLAADRGSKISKNIQQMPLRHNSLSFLAAVTLPQ